jgi:hypothetical protein
MVYWKVEKKAERMAAMTADSWVGMTAEHWAGWMVGLKVGMKIVSTPPLVNKFY